MKPFPIPIQVYLDNYFKTNLYCVFTDRIFYEPHNFIRETLMEPVFHRLTLDMAAYLGRVSARIAHDRI